MVYIESPDQFRNTTKQKLDELKTAIEAVANESKTIDLAKVALSDAPMKAKADALTVRAAQLKIDFAAKIAEIKAYFPSDAGVLAATTELSARVEKILKDSEIGKLKIELDQLAAEVTPGAVPVAGVKKLGDLVEAEKAAVVGAVVPLVEDMQTPQEVDAGKSAFQKMGLLKYQPMFKMALSLYSTWMSFNRLMCMGDQACVQGVDGKLKGFQDQYNSFFGLPEFRDGFNAILEKKGISVRPGRDDAVAFARLKELKRQNPGKSSDDLIAEIAQEYAGIKGNKTNHVITLSGILFGRDSTEFPQKTLIGDAASSVKIKDAAGEQTYNVKVKGDTIMVDGKSFKLQSEDGSPLEFEQAEFWKKGDIASLFLTVTKEGKRVLSLTLDSSDRVTAFLKGLKSGASPDLPPGVSSAWFGFKSVPIVIKLVSA